jgi:hypothetical protein
MMHNVPNDLITKNGAPDRVGSYRCSGGLTIDGPGGQENNSGTPLTAIEALHEWRWICQQLEQFGWG